MPITFHTLQLQDCKIKTHTYTWILSDKSLLCLRVHPPLTKSVKYYETIEFLGVKLYLNQITIIYVIHFFLSKCLKITFLYYFDIVFFSTTRQRSKNILLSNNSVLQIKTFHPRENSKMFLENLKFNRG